MEEMGRSRDQIKSCWRGAKTLLSWMLVGVREEGYQVGGILGKKKEADVRGADTAVRV